MSYKKQLMKSNVVSSIFLKNVSKLALGAGIAQLITILFSPILTRLFLPEQYGIFALYVSLITILSVFSTCRYEFAIVLPKFKRRAEELYFLCIFITVLVSILFFVLAFLFGKKILIFLNFDSLSDYIFLIPLSIFLAGVTQTNDLWLNRIEKYKHMGFLRIIQSLAIATVTILLGYLFPSASSLIFGNLIGMTIFMVAGFIFLKGSIASHLQKIKFKNLLASFRRNIDFLKFGTPAGLLSVGSYQSLFIFSGFYFGSYILGIFYLLERIIGLPSSVLGNSLGQVFYRSISKIEPKKCFNELISFLKRLIILSLALHLFLYFGLYYLLVPIFGETWSDTTQYFIFFIIVGSFSFIFAPITYMFNYLKIQNANLVWQGLWLITNLILFIICYLYALDVKDFLILYVIKQCLLYFMGITGIIIYTKRIQEVS
tara:strand:+ start:1143 stop:2432 length:1290 start_codon:yes stop_codon:yes gene_type:complete